MNHDKLLQVAKILTTDLANKVRKFRQDWIKNKVCECCNNVIEGNDVYCKHMKDYLKHFFKEETKEIEKLNLLMIQCKLR